MWRISVYETMTGKNNQVTYTAATKQISFYRIRSVMQLSEKIDVNVLRVEIKLALRRVSELDC